MNVNIKQVIIDAVKNRVDAIGFAPVDRFDEAPENHHPSVICQEAKTVIVIGKVVPKGMLHSPKYSHYFLHRTYHTVYPLLDDLCLEISNLIEKIGFLAVPIPSYAPMVFHDIVPWGILSLKHAAVAAGLGVFGRSGITYHPEFGSMLRLAAVVTSIEIQGDPIIDNYQCPPKCRACHDACPSKAFDDEGNFHKMKCLGYTIRHGIYPLALKDEAGIKNIEMIINTAGHNYWLKCNECLRVCPKNKISIKQK